MIVITTLLTLALAALEPLGSRPLDLPLSTLVDAPLDAFDLPFALDDQFALLGRTVPRASNGGTGNLLTTANLSCEKKFRIAVTQAGGSPALNAAGYSRVAYRYDTGDGKRHFFTMRSDQRVMESVEPTATNNCADDNSVIPIAAAARRG